MSTPNYWQMSKEDLIKAAEAFDLKVEDPKSINRKELIEAIKIETVKRGEGDEMLIEGDEGLEEVKPGDVLVNVTFHRRNEQDAPYVFLGHNGRAFYLPVEKEIRIPQYLLDSCVKDAVETRFKQITMPNGKIGLEETKIHRFPFTRHV